MNDPAMLKDGIFKIRDIKTSQNDYITVQAIVNGCSKEKKFEHYDIWDAPNAEERFRYYFDGKTKASKAGLKKGDKDRRFLVRIELVFRHIDCVMELSQLTNRLVVRQAP